MKVHKGSVWVRLNRMGTQTAGWYKEGALIESTEDGDNELHYNNGANTAEISKFRRANDQESSGLKMGKINNVNDLPYKKGTIVVRTKAAGDTTAYQRELGAIYKCVQNGYKRAYYGPDHSTPNVRFATDAEIKAFHDGVLNIRHIVKQPPTPAIPTEQEGKSFKYKVGNIVVRTQNCSSKHSGLYQVEKGAMWSCTKRSNTLAYYAEYSGSSDVRHATKREIEFYQGGVKNINEKLKNGHFYRHNNGSIIRWNSNINDAEWAINTHDALIKEGSYLNDLSQFYVPSPEEIAWLKNSISRGYVVGDRPRREHSTVFFSDTSGVHINVNDVTDGFKWDNHLKEMNNTTDAPNIHKVNPTEFESDVYVTGLDPVNSQFDASSIQKRLELLNNGGLEKNIREGEYEIIMNQLMGGFNPYSNIPQDNSVAMGIGIRAQIENANKSKVKRKIPGLIEVKDRR